MMNIKNSKKVVSLTAVSSMYFSGVNWGPLWERPLSDRVVSTAQWPVPYYQRLFKAYPVREKRERQSLLINNQSIGDVNWYTAKMNLKNTYEGREIVDYADNHWKSNSFIPIKNDIERQAGAYVSDLVGYIDVANKENKRILEKTDLI
mmetsp:Transcript_21727/g.25217  ORF Transcript_21727/g.25217 Transcript_21727/m.25217 type:complete len:148 (+) Transcript_21727:52-495(+)